MRYRSMGWSLCVPACLIIGLALMIPFEATITRILGVAFLFAFIVAALFLILEPRFLAHDRE